MQTDPVITIDDLSFTYAHADRPALRGIDLEIRRCEYVGIMGLNGAGKTTLGLCLNGVIPHLVIGEMTGRIRVAGQDPSVEPVREMARTVGMVFDDPESQMSQVTAAEEVAFGLENLAVPREEMADRIALALDLVGLAGVAERAPLALSAGQQQRLAIAAVLAMRPAILFMDEPTANLDPQGTREIFVVVGRRNQTEGMTGVVAEHGVVVLAVYADRIVVLAEGRIVLEGPPRAVLSQVERLDSHGLRPPQVTQLAHRLSGRSVGLPMTIDETLGWLRSPA
jgi:energy-coupling factor transporter ATP-binding protein EcfA2